MSLTRVYNVFNLFKPFSLDSDQARAIRSDQSDAPNNRATTIRPSFTSSSFQIREERLDEKHLLNIHVAQPLSQISPLRAATNLDKVTHYLYSSNNGVRIRSRTIIMIVLISLSGIYFGSKIEIMVQSPGVLRPITWQCLMKP